MKSNNKFAGVDQLTLRSIIIGMLGSCIITASSMYVALRISSLPWPTIFVSILSMTVLKALGKTNLNEINITQTAMSSGAMIAGGIAFTLPGLWITGAWKDTSMKSGHLVAVILISLAGMLLGTILTYFLRYKFVEGEKLPYPIGSAAVETIEAGDKAGKKSIGLFATIGISALFTLLRDNFGVIPSALVSKSLYAKNYLVGIWLSPMAVGMGYIIGALYTGVWFLGAILSYIIIIPFGISFKIFQSQDAAVAFKNTAGIGLMVGTGIGVLISFILSWINNSRNKEQSKFSIKSSKTVHILAFGSILAAFVLSVLCGIDVIPSLLMILGAFLVSAMAATITGQTGINPMEVFGIIILLAVRIFVDINTVQAFFIAACVAVSCGYSGDLLNEYKAGYILGTNPKAQLISQIAGGVVGVLVSGASMFAIIGQFKGVGPHTGLSAGQAFAVSQMIKGIGSPVVFFSAVVIGSLLYLFKVPSMTLGLGMYLSFEISAAIFLGGFIRFLVERLKPEFREDGNIVASGFLGGEGITGVSVAIIKMFIGS